MKRSRKENQQIQHIKQHQFAQLAVIKRDEELPSKSIVDSKNKIVTDSNLYNPDFALEQGKNFYTLQGLKARRYTVADGVQRLIGPEQPKPLRSFRHFHQE